MIQFLSSKNNPDPDLIKLTIFIQKSINIIKKLYIYIIILLVINYYKKYSILEILNLHVQTGFEKKSDPKQHFFGCNQLSVDPIPYPEADDPTKSSGSGSKTPLFKLVTYCLWVQIHIRIQRPFSRLKPLIHIHFLYRLRARSICSIRKEKSESESEKL